MKKVMAKLLNVDKKTLIFLIIISFIGLLTGSIFMTVLDSSDKILINDTLSNFMNNIEPTNYMKALTETLILNIVYVIFIWLLGISVIGIPIVIFFIFMQSFLLSFSLASFIANYGIKGLLIGTLYNFPHNFINLILFIYLGVYSIRLSFMIINSVVRRKNIDFKAIMNRYLLVVAVALITVILTSLIGTFVTPYLLKLLLNVL